MDLEKFLLTIIFSMFILNYGKEKDQGGKEWLGRISGLAKRRGSY